MKKFIVMAVAVCVGWVGSSQKVFAGPAPISAQEMTQLNGLSCSGLLLEKKAGGSFPGSPVGLVATEESALRHLEKGSSQLGSLKAGDGPVDVLVLVAVVVCCILLIRLVI